MFDIFYFMPPIIDLIGKTFGRLLVISRDPTSKRNIKWNCLCQCGNYTLVSGGKLKMGTTKSCGCLKHAPILKFDLTGQIFGKLTVIDRFHSEKKDVYWNCICLCGNTNIVNSDNLKRGISSSCGKCIRRERKPIEDITNQSFNYLTAIRQDLSHRRVYWICKCKCGTIVAVDIYKLKSGHTRSCGCYRKMHVHNKTHGMSRNRIYKIWIGMKYRCESPKHDSWYRYGGRGITVCDEWQDFFVFMQWALLNGYDDKLTIERDDINIGYNPANCRWIPQSEQSLNTSRTIRLETKLDILQRINIGEPYAVISLATGVGVSSILKINKNNKHLNSIHNHTHTH